MKRWRNAGESTGVHAGTETPPYVKGPAKKLAETLAENITNKARARVVDEMVSRYDAYIDKMKVYYTDDPSIPSFIKRLIKGLWDSITPHFRSEFMEIIEAEIGLRKQHAAEALALDMKFREAAIKSYERRNAVVRHCRWLSDSLRSSLLYVTYPYDKSMWKAMERPSWWVILGLRACPFFGIGSLSYAALLGLMDKQDHYQLVAFILNYKSTQFLVNGGLGLMWYSGFFSFCAISSGAYGESTCGANYPGTYRIGPLDPNLVTFPVVVGFFLQITLIWVALYLLKFSQTKGGTVRRGLRLVGDHVQWKVYDANDPIVPFLVEQRGQRARKKVTFPMRVKGEVVSYDRKSGLHTVELTSRGNSLGIASIDGAEGTASVEVPLHTMKYYVQSEKGPLRNLLYYDLVCFLACLGLASFVLAFTYLEGNLEQDWQLRSTLLGLQIGYSLCAFPFFFASLPPWSSVFTHARATGYTRHGVCVARMLPQAYGWVIQYEVVQAMQTAAAKSAHHAAKSASAHGSASANGEKSAGGKVLRWSRFRKSTTAVKQAAQDDASVEREDTLALRIQVDKDTQRASKGDASKAKSKFRSRKSRGVPGEKAGWMGQRSLSSLTEATTEATGTSVVGDDYGSVPGTPRSGSLFPDVEDGLSPLPPSPPSQPQPHGSPDVSVGGLMRMEDGPAAAGSVGHGRRFRRLNTRYAPRLDTIPSLKEEETKEEAKGGEGEGGVGDSFEEPQQVVQPSADPASKENQKHIKYDNMVVRMPKAAKPGDTVEFEVKGTGQKARITIPPKGSGGGQVTVKVPHKSSFSQPFSPANDELPALSKEEEFDEVTVRLPRSAKPGDTVEFAIKGTGQLARITVPAKAKRGQKIAVKVPAKPPKIGRPVVGHRYRVLLASSHGGMRGGAAYLDVHRSGPKDEFGAGFTFALVHEFTGGARAQEHTGGEWRLEPLTQEELEEASASTGLPAFSVESAGEGLANFFRLQLVSSHYGTPPLGYLAGVCPDAAFTIKASNEAKQVSRDDDSTWAFLAHSLADLAQSPIHPNVSTVWGLEACDGAKGADGKWRLRLVPTTKAQSEGGSRNYLEVHLDKTKGLRKDARNQVSTYVHLHQQPGDAGPNAAPGLAPGLALGLAGQWSFEKLAAHPPTAGVPAGPPGGVPARSLSDVPLGTPLPTSKKGGSGWGARKAATSPGAGPDNV